MKTKLFPILALAACLSVAGCGKKDDEINAAMKDLNTFTTEMVAKVQKATDPATGVIEAQKYFEAQQSELKKKLSVIKDVRGFQVTEDAQKKMQSDITNNVTAVASLQITYARLS